MAANSANNWSLNKAYFGPLWEYVSDDEITNIDWDSGQLWLQRANRIREMAFNPDIDETFMHDFAIRVGNHAGLNFNKTDRVVMAETDKLRIVCIHPSFSLSGVSVCIRKSLPKLRFNAKMAVEAGYCEEATMHLLINCVLAQKNLVFCGEPSKGKTEAAKFFSTFIPPHKKVVTIEDVREWHYKEINRGKKSCIELKVKNKQDFEEALALAVRLNPSWLMPAEVRGREARYLLEAWSNGISNMTTLHTSSVAGISDRILNMLGSDIDIDSVRDQIYENVGVGVLLDEVEIGDGKTKHFIKEVAFFYRDSTGNHMAQVVEDGVLMKEKIPAFIHTEIKKNLNIDDIFYCASANDNNARLIGEEDFEMETIEE